MELAIIAGLGALGWAFSAKGTPPRNENQNTPSIIPDDSKQTDFPFDADVEGTVALDEDTARIRRHTSQFEPFVTSDKTAHVNNQRRMELFSGADTTSWSRKSERPQLFQPFEKKVAVGSGGTAKSADPLYDPQDLVDRNVFGTKMNNILPFEQTRVGPGLGVGMDVPSTDGLHSQFRVLPTDALDAHRVNQLPGRAASGAAIVTNGGRRYDTFEQNKPSLVGYTPNMGAGKTQSYNGHVWMTMPENRPTKSTGTSKCYTGTGVSTLGNKVYAPLRGHHVQRADKCLPANPLLASRSVLLAPTETSTAYDKYEHGTNRQDAGELGVTGPSNVRKQMYAADGYTLKARKDRLCAPHVAGGAAATARAIMADGCYVIKDTTRDCTAPGMVPGAHVVNAGSTRVPELEVSGLRENSVCHTVGNSHYLKKKPSARCYALGRGRETQGRCGGGALLGGLTTELAQAGRIQRKRMANAFCKPPHGHALHAIQDATPGCSKSKKKVPSENPRTQTLGLGLVCTPTTA
jgi:hypothetical protein